MDLDLTDPRVLIFDGIFDSDDLDRRFFDFVQSTIERRSFTTTGGTGDQDDPVR